MTKYHQKTIIKKLYPHKHRGYNFLYNISAFNGTTSNRESAH